MQKVQVPSLILREKKKKEKKRKEIVERKEDPDDESEREMVRLTMNKYLNIFGREPTTNKNNRSVQFLSSSFLPCLKSVKIGLPRSSCDALIQLARQITTRKM